MAPDTPPSHPVPPGRPRRWLAPLAALAVVAALAAVALTRGGEERTPAAGGPAATGTTADEPRYGPIMGIERRHPDDPLALGRPDAPVVMVEYADYRCPFCSKFAVDTQPELVERYVEHGVLRIEWRDFPIFGAQSEAAARAGRAAARQERFWEFHRLVAEAAPDSGHPALPQERLVAFARRAGVPDIARFRRDMASAEIARDVAADRDEALSLGVTSTPAFVVNGFPLLGAQPQEEFAALIERARGAG